MIGGRYIPGNGISTEEALKTFGQHLKEKRLALNATQAQVETQSGVSLTVIKRLESGKPISTENLVKLLKAYGLIGSLLDLYKPEEISLEDQWHLIQKNLRNKRQRASTREKKSHP